MVFWLMACLQSGVEDSSIRKEGETESGDNTDSRAHSADSQADSRGDSATESSVDSPTDDSGRTDSQPDSGVDSGVQDLAPDFLLADVNSVSARYGELISPRDYLQQVSGWYFIHST